MRRRLARAVAALGGALALAGPAPALEASNLELVTAAAQQAVRQAAAGVDARGVDAHEAVIMRPAASHAANWLFEHLLAEELLGRGLAVALDSSGVASAAPRLTYRVVDLSVSGRARLLHGSVTRRCRVALQLDFARGGEHLWTGEGRAELSDEVPQRELEALQHSRYAFARTELEKRSWGKFVEPVIVTTVLGSLVYLFFSNR